MKVYEKYDIRQWAQIETHGGGMRMCKEQLEKRHPFKHEDDREVYQVKKRQADTGGTGKEDGVEESER